ncbi:hypothetical protein F2981_29420 (plasmid) [Sinorhizobium meliloti]|nr:hypothetical protein [Sinorhizobium meliloti]
MPVASFVIFTNMPPSLKQPRNSLAAFAALIRGDDENDDLERWIADARDRRTGVILLRGIERDIER